MNNTLYKYFIELENMIDKILSDKYINYSTRWQYERYKKLMVFLHNEYDI